MEQPAGLEADQPQRAFTVKSLIFGLIGIGIIAGVASIRANLMGSSPYMVGNHLPAGVFFYLMIVAIGWNGIMGRISARLVLSPQELAVVMGMTLVACFAPTSGMFRYLHRQLLLPWYYLGTGGRPEWQSLNLFNYLPSFIFPQPVPEFKDGILHMDQTVYGGFFTGLARGDTPLGITELPYAGWVKPMLFWGPVVLLMSVCVMGISMLVHQQWVRYEQLSYPVAQVAAAFVRRAKGKGVPDVFRSRLFWWGFVPVFTFYTVEYLNQWFPEYVPSIKSVFPDIKSWYVPIGNKFPVIYKAPVNWAIQGSTLYFCIVGLAYFVSNEISFTLGISHLLLTFFGIWWFRTTGTPLQGPMLDSFRAGSYLGYITILLYTGRSFYWAIARKAVLVGRPTEHEAASVLAARITLLSFAGFVGLLTVAGLDWLIALFFGLVLMLMFTVMTRVVCETGIPFLQTGWFPFNIINPLMGNAAVGPGPQVWINYLGSVFCQDPRECLMPYAATSLKLADEVKIGIRRFFWVMVVAVTLAFIIGFFANHWSLYSYGSAFKDGYAGVWPPQNCFNNSAKAIQELKDTDQLAASESWHGLKKLGHLMPQGDAMRPLLLGAVAVLSLSLLRFRFAKFPLHPVVFLVVGSYAGYMSWYSFLVGWGIKVMVVRFGGGRVYQNFKPVFIGIISAELMAVGTCIFIELLYYSITGNVPQVSFGILPG